MIDRVRKKFALVCFASTFGGLMRSRRDATEKIVELMVYIGFLKERIDTKFRKSVKHSARNSKCYKTYVKRLINFFLSFPKRRILYEYMPLFYIFVRNFLCINGIALSYILVFKVRVFKLLFFMTSFLSFYYCF